ncbi:hypothetical protein F0562_006084 [Nyssa sinensis]|uniref:CRIB domain-containing protein n=1 Tax=Nyssa sinensis TaxID=561372 RepID=A0A5J5AJY0_9ASTE|nr:hypothetical protein F0562_006084 [Nyssa sinensis]
MKDRMEKLVVLPFSTGCVSQNSVAVGASQQPKKSKSESNPPVKGRQEKEQSSSGVKMKNSWGFLALPKSNISHGMHRLMRSFKKISELFVYKEETEEMEMEMEIGFPTDVMHVTHIGWDGTTTTNPVKGWENLKAPEILSFPAISLRQFELAMAAQAAGPLGVTTSKFT